MPCILGQLTSRIRDRGDPPDPRFSIFALPAAAVLAILLAVLAGCKIKLVDPDEYESIGKSRAAGPSAPAVAAPAAPPAPARAPGRYRPYYERRVAAVIGIDRYRSWPPLEGAAGDARHVASSLRERGFDEVIEIYDEDASRARILELLGVELSEKTGSDDLALIFFAGHGHTETLPQGEKRGYIIPADGDRSHVFSTAISMETVRDLSNRLPAKHVYYAMDSCYSGLGFARGRGVAAGGGGYIGKVTARRAVQMITAGQEGEVALERGGRGIFTSYLLSALEGQADFDGDGYVTASEIGAYVPHQVTTATRNRQTPMYGTLEGTGEVVFEVAEPQQPERSRGTRVPDPEDLEATRVPDPEELDRAERAPETVEPRKSP